MRKVDLFWKSNHDWWTYKNGFPVLKESAPPEAKESYKRYLEQTNVNHYRKDTCITGAGGETPPLRSK